MSRYRGILTLDSLSGALNRNLKLIFVSNFIGAFGDSLYIYLLPLYIRALGAGPVEVGIVFSILSGFRVNTHPWGFVGGQI